ncbi:MAG: DNA-directed RNA polymerase subunit L, partial [Candidatus Woesearchaeota archaeon]|nr:DNA-directed RNA polymerase subunit L [Candidatus Woesearchaeota archaeon]
NILEESKTKLKFELKDESHTFCNILRKELWEDSSVKLAGYNIPHSLIGTPIFIIETTNASPKKTLLSAISRLQKKNKDFKEKIKKLK